MDKLLVSVIVLLLGCGTMLNAQGGGYTGPGGSQVVSVQAAKKLRDDSPVILQGKILKSLGGEKYLFSDDSDTITIEIDNRLWRTISVSDNDLVEISGEVDKERARIEIEVSSIRKLSGSSAAQSTQSSGYTGPSSQVVSVQAAKKLQDDSPVILRGKILKSLGGEKYLFSDDSDTITIEIDDDLWRGISVSDNDLVEISGEVDKERTRVKIDVSSIRKVAGK